MRNTIVNILLAAGTVVLWRIIDLKMDAAYLATYIAVFITFEALDRSYEKTKNDDVDPKDGVRTVEATGRDSADKVPA